MFRDEPAEQALARAQVISDLKNLGPQTEKYFLKAGIKTAAELRRLGWKKAMIKLVASNPKHRHSLFAYALIGALKNLDWNAIPDEEKKAAREFCASLKPAKKAHSKKAKA